MGKKFEPSFKSLYEYSCPDWFLDAKFGIWSHWGPQSVPMYGDWYARHMYVEGSPQYLYHLRHYGHPSKFGYKDICALWKAEKFDPEGLMELYHKAGARYFVGQAMHHDHFFNFPSKINRFNSVDVGPKKDICGLWKKAAEKHNMPFGLTEHLSATFSWWKTNKGADKEGLYAGVPYDGNDPEYRDFYLDNYEHLEDKNNDSPWYTGNKDFREYWLKVMKELIDLYVPDLLYTDGGLPFKTTEVHSYNPDILDVTDDEYNCGLEAVAYLYNKSMEKNGENRAVYTQKDRRADVYKVGVLDIEKSQLPDILESPWQTDTCIGNWFYDVRQVYKKPGHVIEMLIDIIAKNGTMLLNVLQRPDGSIDDEAVWLLEEIGSWFNICSEAVYGTRPWKVSGEGDSRVSESTLFEEKKVEWNSSDYRFTKKGNTVYSFIMRTPDNKVAIIKSFTDGEKVKAVKLLGHGEVEFSQNFGILTVKLPENMPTIYSNCLAIEI